MTAWDMLTVRLRISNRLGLSKAGDLAGIKSDGIDLNKVELKPDASTAIFAGTAQTISDHRYGRMAVCLEEPGERVPEYRSGFSQ